MNTHVVSQYPLSSNGNVDQEGAHQNDQGQRVSSEDEALDLDDEGMHRVGEFKATHRDIMPLICYKLVYFCVIVVPPIIFANESIEPDCKNSPHYISHIIFLVLQFILVGLSTHQHKNVAAQKGQGIGGAQQSQGSPQNGPCAQDSTLQGLSTGSGLINSQGRCCRELLSQMKLANTYTNFCFIGIVLNIFIQHLNSDNSARRSPMTSSIPLYMLIVSLASAGVYLLLKISITVVLIIFSCKELKQLALSEVDSKQKTTQPDNGNSSRQVDRMTNDIKAQIEQTLERSRIQKRLVHLLLWLDLEAFAKLYDGEERSETEDYVKTKAKYAFLKVTIEDLPLCAMQALFLYKEVCSQGLNTIIILSLYFNGICFLYALSNICSQGQSKDRNKIYKKELDRLKDYYDAGNTQVRVVAEFYIEDSLEVQAIKMQALNDFLADNSNDVNNFNFSTNQLGVKTLNSLNDILRNCAESLQELTLSRCRLSSSHINTLMFSAPKNTFQMLGNLTKLNLSENRINDKGAAIISNYIIQHNKDALLSLNLEQNFLTLNGAKSILEAVRSSKSLFQILIKRNKVPPVNGPNPQENAQVCMLIFEILKVCQVNYLRYVRDKLGSGMSWSQNRQRPIEQFLVRLSANNESFDKVLCQMFRIDAFQQTVRTLDLSLRFFKGSQNGASPAKGRGKMGDQLLRPEFVETEESRRYFQYYRGMRSYDDEQRLILMSLHYNSKLKEVFQMQYGLELTIKTRQQAQVGSAANSDIQIYYLANSVVTLNLSSDWFPCKSFGGGSSSPQTLIFETISRFESLHEVLFNNNSIKGHNGGAEFYNALATAGKNLTMIKVKSCQYSPNVNAATFEKAFKACFTQMANLKVLNLSYSNLSDPLIEGLADCIGNMPAIVKLNLKQCGLTHQSVDRILESLSLNTGKSTLACLNLSGNTLQGLQYMGKFLAKSNCSGSLEQLKMANCKLGDLELKQLSRGLMISRTLRVLDLSQNQIQNVGYIKEGIQSNIALEKLDLSTNQIDNEGITNLTQALVFNRSIETLAIAFNKYTLSGLKKLFTTLFQYPQIQGVTEKNANEDEKSSIVNLSFAIPKFDRENDYTELCNLLLKTLIPPQPEKPLPPPTNHDEDDSDSKGGDSEDQDEDQFTDEEEEKKKGENRPQWHKFRRLEILGDKVKKLRNPSDFFFLFFRDGCANVEEIIIDSILKKNQLNDMVRGLFAVMQPEKSALQNQPKIDESGATQQQQRQIQQQQRLNNAQLTKKDMRRIARHKLERVTFIKPQEFSEEIQMLETLLDQKLNIAATYNQRKYHYLQQKKGPKYNPQQQQQRKLSSRQNMNNHQLQMMGDNSGGLEFGDEEPVRFDPGNGLQSRKKSQRQNYEQPIDTSGEGNLDSLVIEESIITQRGVRKEGSRIGDIETKIKQKSTIVEVGGREGTKRKVFAKKGVKLPAEMTAAADLMPIQDDENDGAPIDLDDVRMDMQQQQDDYNYYQQQYEDGGDYYQNQQYYQDDQQQYMQQQQHYQNSQGSAEEYKQEDDY